jgi:hypothetical protein
MAMPVGLRARYFENIPRHQAERNLHLAQVTMLPHMDKGVDAVLKGWQVTAKWIRESTAQGVRRLRHFLRETLDPKYGVVDEGD